MEVTRISINCGVSRIIGRRNGVPVLSAIGKSPVEEETVLVGKLIGGDEQANRSVHGGPDQAVCVYTADHWLGRTDLAHTMTLSGRCGWYMRVVHEGSASSRKAIIWHIPALAGPVPSMLSPHVAIRARH